MLNGVLKTKINLLWDKLTFVIILVCIFVTDPYTDLQFQDKLKSFPKPFDILRKSIELRELEQECALGL